MIQLSTKLDRLPPYLFARIDTARADAEARGIETVSMGIGDPDRDPPEWIRQYLAEEVMRSGNHRYPKYKGNPKLWDAVLRYVERRFGVGGLGHEHVMTTIGSKEGLANLVTALIDRDDVVIMPDPMYPVFGTMGRLAGAAVVTLPVHPDTNFMPDPRQFLTPEQMRAAKVMYLNYPHNPTGRVATREYLQGLVDFAREYEIIIVSDAAYAEVYYGEENRPPSLLELEGALDCTIEFQSFSKSFNMTGWRCGFAIGNPELIAGLSTVKSNVDSGCFNAIQLALARTLDDDRCDAFLAENRTHYQGRMERVCAELERMGVTIHRPGATIFVWCDLPAGETSAMEWCGRLLSTTGLVVGPGAAYGEYGEGFFRVSLSTPDDRIGLALGKLESFLKSAGAGAT
jgi:LL-diaminopimelate aminotransferase